MGNISWKEIEASAEQHAAAIQMKCAEDEKRRKLAQDTAQKKEKIKETAIFDLLQKFQVVDVLETIKDEVWQEGYIQRIDPTKCNDWHAGYILTTEPYLALNINSYLTGKKMPSLVMKEYIPTHLNVFTSYDGETINESRLFVEISFLYDIKRASEQRPFLDTLKDRNFQGLRQATLSDWAHSRAQQWSIPLNRDTAVTSELFHYAIASAINEQKNYDSLPKQVRDWTASVVADLPEQLQEILKTRRSLTSAELQHLENKLTHNRFGLLFDRITVPHLK